jgi:hypothetical protein
MQWARNDAVAVVHTRDSVIARTTDGRRSRVLWTGVATWVVLDSALDLVWVQGNETLDVIDLRAESDEVVAVAKGLPAALPITIIRTTSTATHASASPSSCDSGRSLTLEWKEDPRLRLLDARAAGWTDPEGATLVGASWLRKQLARPRREDHAPRREFPFSEAPPGSPFSARQSKCPAAPCGMPISFDGSGVELVVTSLEQGDCLHLGCHLYDPAKKKFATPPSPTTWGEIESIPSGPCGPYHFDRAGKHFLIDRTLCAVGGLCQDLGGQAVGWLSAGVDVGSGG